MPACLCGTWDIVSNVNMEGYMIALGKSLTHFIHCALKDLKYLHIYL